MRLAPLFLIAPLLLAGAEFQIQPGGDPLRIRVDKTGLYSGKSHLLEFRAYSGLVRLDEANPSASGVELTVNAADFRLMDEWVSDSDRKSIVEYTKSDKVLHVEKFPQILFRGAAAERSAAGWRVNGQLTVRGVSKPVVLSVAESREGASLTFTGKLVFGMKQFGIKPPSAALGLIGTKDEMHLEFSVKAVP